MELAKNFNGKMSSLEIAELVGKRHDNVMRTIKRMQPAWVAEDALKFEEIYYLDKHNREQPMFLLTKAECYYILTNYSHKITAKVFLRWIELEKRVQTTKQLSPAQALLQNAQILVAQEIKLIEHDDRLNLLEAKTTTIPDYFTVAGFAVINKVFVDAALASKIGRMASKMCEKANIVKGETTCPRWGIVGTYPKHILIEIFKELGLI